MISKTTARPLVSQRQQAKTHGISQTLRFGEDDKKKKLDAVASVCLSQAPLLRQLLETMETAISKKQVSVEQVVEVSGWDRTLKLQMAGLPVELSRKRQRHDSWTLVFPTKNIQFTLFQGEWDMVRKLTTEVTSLDKLTLPYAIEGFWAKRGIWHNLKSLDKRIDQVLSQQVVQQQQDFAGESKNSTAKSALKDLLKTQIDLLTAKQDHYQPLIQNLERQYAEAQTHTETSIGRERLEALRGQFAKAQEKDREHRQDTLRTIAELQEKQVRLELTENNEALLRMMDESKALIRASEERMQSVGPEIDVNYETTRILLAPNTSEATARVQERVQARLTEPAPTPPSALEQAIAAATSKSRQTAEISHESK